MNYLSSSMAKKRPDIWVYSNPETPCDQELIASGNCHLKPAALEPVVFDGNKVTESSLFGVVRCIKD